MSDRIKTAIEFVKANYPENSDAILRVLLDQAANRQELAEELSAYVRERNKKAKEAE